MGREGIEPPVSETAGLQPAAPHGATDPLRGQIGAGPDDDVSAVVKVRTAGLDVRREHARKDSNLRPAVLETAAPPWLERKKESARMTLCASGGKGAVTQTEIVELPAHVGPAGFGRFPTSRPQLMIERLARKARIDAKAQRGCTSERLRGGEDACHRSVDGEPSSPGCQRNFVGAPTNGRAHRDDGSADERADLHVT